MIRRLIVAATATTLVGCYFAVLRGMFEQWSNDEDMGHGFAVPIVILWIVWKERSRWMTLPAQPSSWGFGVLAVAAFAHYLSAAGAGLFAGSISFVLSVAGAVLCLGGIAYLRIWTFPFLLALFMLPKLAVFYNQVTLPLQLLASRLAEGLLSVSAASVTRDGNILGVNGHMIAVVEACSGIRYLLSLGFMAVVFAYLSDAKLWMRGALLVAAVPIAVLANAMRVAVSALVPALDSGALHTVTGSLLFVLSLTMLLIVRSLLNRAYDRHHA